MDEKQMKEHIGYLSLNHPLMPSEIEEEFLEYMAATGRKDFIGFELNWLPLQRYYQERLDYFRGI